MTFGCLMFGALVEVLKGEIFKLLSSVLCISALGALLYLLAEKGFCWEASGWWLRSRDGLRNASVRNWILIGGSCAE